MEPKMSRRGPKITLNDITRTMEVLNRNQLKQVKGGDNDPTEPIRR